MNDATTTDLVLVILDKVARDIESSQHYLTDLDSALGDGDHGVSMTIGFRAVRKALPALAGESVADVLYKTGMHFQAAAGATVGALLGSAMMKAATALKDAPGLGVNELSLAIQVMNHRVMELGKSQVGDKTMVDAIAPAAEAASVAAAGGKTTLQALEAALDAARNGMESTKDMVCKKGRASRLGERTRGHQDPGATSCYLILKSVVEFLQDPANRSSCP